MINRLRAIGAFWYDVVVGDDWRLAAGMCLVLAATYVVSALTSLAAWWLLPVTVAGLLPASLIRRHPRAAHAAVALGDHRSGGDTLLAALRAGDGNRTRVISLED